MSGTLYLTKPVQVYAEQWRGDQEQAEELLFWVSKTVSSGEEVEGRISIQVRQTPNQHFKIETSSLVIVGPVSVRLEVGDYLVFHPHDGFKVYTEGEFKKKFNSEFGNPLR